MNKKGVMAFVYFMIGILLFVLGLALAPSLNQTSDEVQTELDCLNVSISNQDKAVCYQLDSMTPVYIGIIFAFAGIIITRLVT